VSIRTVLCAALLMIPSMTQAADWKPAPSPLMTRWAKDVDPKNPLPEYPRPQMVRKDWMNLNGLWQFATAEEVKETPIGKDLPGQILVPFPMESALSGVGKHADRSWYRRRFHVPESWRGRRILLHFGAVDYHCEVMINGRPLGAHTGGYDPFSFDITDALAPGASQEIIVFVEDTTDPSQAKGKQVPKPGGIMYTSVSGIWQTVWIEPVPKNYIRSVEITPDVENRIVYVKVDAAPKTFFEANTKDGDSTLDRASFYAGQKAAINVQDEKHPLKLWSPESPNLYGLTIDLIENGHKIDSVECYFGMRSISVGEAGGKRRILLNGKPVFQVGPLDQGFRPDGIYTAPTDEALKYDIEMEKKLGFNMLRKHVKVEPQRFYYWADKLGILVWQDMPSTFDGKNAEKNKQFETELDRMIRSHMNSPSIVTWVVFNEGWGEYDAPNVRRVCEAVKKIDPTRLVNDASGWFDYQAGDMHDIHVYPGPSSPEPEKTRAIVLGEFGGLGLGVDGHTWSSKTWGYQGMDSKNELTDKYCRLLGRLWQLHDETGLSAGVYTQTTDVETECNGLMTYDREVLKVDEARVRQANTGRGPRISIKPVVPTAQIAPQEWRYMTDAPAQNWFAKDFDDTSWKTGQSGFGTEGTPGAIVNTVWNTPDIWIRREFSLPELSTAEIKDLQLSLHHDEDCEVYINGVVATKAKRFTMEYDQRRISPEALATLHPGKNTFAIHCHNTEGGQYIDAGLVTMTLTTPPAKDQ
jgi:hypothetical protein